MSFLSDFYRKSKKKLNDAFDSTGNKVSSGLNSTYSGMKRSARSAVNYANNPQNTPDWLKSVDKGLHNFSSAAENVPKFNFSQKVKNPVGKFAAVIPETILNLPSNTVRTTFKDYGKIDTSPSYLVKRGAEAANIGIDIGSTLAGGPIIKSLAKEGFKRAGKATIGQVFKEGAKRGATEGAVYGTTQGALSGLQDGENLKEQGKNALKTGVMGGIMGTVAGGVLGGGISSAGHETSRIIKDVKNLKNPYAKRVVTKYDYEPVPGVYVGPNGQNQRRPIIGSERKVVETVKLPFQPKSITGKLLGSRAGLNIEDVNLRKPKVVSSIDPIAQKRAQAKALVNKQIDNQKAGLPTAEPGFVVPQSVQAPQIKQSSRGNIYIKTGKNEVVKIPKTIQNDLYEAGQGNIPTPERRMKANGILNRSGLEMTAEGKIVQFQTPEPTKKPLLSIDEFVNGKAKEEAPFKGDVPFDKEFPPKKMSVEEFVNNSGKDKKLAEALGASEKDYNRWQKQAFAKKEDRIKSIKDVLNEPSTLRQSGYRKAETIKMTPEEAKAKSALIDLGYPKNVVENLDLAKAQKLIDGGVQYNKMPAHIVDRYSQNNPDTPRYVNEDIKKLAGEAQYAAETNKKEFNDIFDNWIGSRDAAKTYGMVKGAKFRDIPKDMGWNVIDSLEYPDEATPENVRYVVNMLRNEWDNIHAEATRSGMNIPYRFDYATHIWRETPEQIQDVVKGAGGKFKFANERDIPTYREGINLGLTPKYNHPAPILAEYAQQLEKTKANIRFLRSLKDKGFVVDASVAQGQAGFSPITATGFPKSISLGPDGEKIVGEYYAPTDIAKTINRVFDTQDNGRLGKSLEIGAKTSGILQDLTLSGGIPKTPINAWTFAQTTKEVLSGRIKSPLLSLLRSTSQNASNGFFETNAGQIKKMQELGIPVETSWNLSNLMDEGFIKNAFTGTEPGIANKIKSTWHKTVNEPTFKRFMPMLQINLFNDIERQAAKSGVSANEATRIAAKAVSNFYGVKSSGASARATQIGKDFTGTLFFAPRYRESMINFWVNNVKAFRHPLALENRNNLKFVAGATLLYGAYDIANKALTGRHLHENPPGKEDKLLIPIGNGKVIGIPFLSSIATMPRMAYRVGKSLVQGDVSGAAKDAFQSSVSMGIKPVADILANSDYFGNEVYDENGEPSEKFKEQATYLFKQYGLAHPYLKTLASTEAGNELLQKVGLGVDKFQPKSGLQLTSEAIESPLRFYDENKIASGQFWDKFKEDVEPKYNKFRELVKTDPTKAEEYYGQNKEAIDSYGQLRDTAQVYSDLKENGIQDQFGGIAKNLGYGLIKTPITEASGGESPQVKTDGMSLDAQNIFKNFEIEEKKKELVNSGKKFMRYDGRIYIVNENGGVNSKSEDEYQSLVYGAQLTNFKRNDEYEKWMEVADKQLEKFTNQLNDPGIDELSKIKIQDDIDRLVDDYQKFTEYGGFTKPKAGKKLEEKYRYPLVDPEFIRINAMISGLNAKKKPRIAKRGIPLMGRRLPSVRRRRIYR